MTNEKDVYDLALHEMADIKSFTVLRVPGGWIYYDKSAEVGVFVPWDNEYQLRSVKTAVKKNELEGIK